MQDKGTTPEEIKQMEEDIKNDPRIWWGGLIWRILWLGVIFWWAVKTCNN